MIDTNLLYAALSLHASIWGAAYFIKRDRQAFLREKVAFQREQATYVSTRAVHAASKDHARCDVCSVCRKVVHRYDIDPAGVVTCHDCKE